MPSTDTPNWWADVQQEREDLAGGRRPADDWLGEEIDFVPRRRMTRGGTATATATAPAERRVVAADEDDRDGADHALHGVFIPAASESSRTIELTTDTPERLPAPKGSRTIELTTADEEIVASARAGVTHELAHLSAADDPFASPPPPAGARRTVQIKGRPTAFGLPSMAQRHRGRTTSERIGHRPDRIALWAVALGAILILLAAMTSSSQAAVTHRAATAPKVTAKVKHAAPAAAKLTVRARH